MNSFKRTGGMTAMALVLKTCVLAVAMLFASCEILTTYAGWGGYGNAGVATAGSVKRQLNVQLVECVGSASSQSVTAVLAVTNVGPNTRMYIGGSSDGSMAVDNYGFTSKPYGSAGRFYELPSGVRVRVEVDDIGPVRPGTPKFQVLRVSFGSGRNNVMNFRNVPIVWMN